LSFASRARRQLVAATANPHKLSEIAAILGSAVELLPRPSDLGEVIEDGPTLEANAQLKARAVCAHTGRAAVADDTGLEVAALGGLPGVRSARYAGERAEDADNRARLLVELQGEADRSARFRTVAIVAFPDGSELAAEGAISGVIAEASRGDQGFGYDPVFVPGEGDGRTFAEMSPEEKNAVSHRGRAFQALAAQLGL